MSATSVPHRNLRPSPEPPSQAGGTEVIQRRVDRLPGRGGIGKTGTVMVAGLEALARLREGNLRFSSNVRSLDAFMSHTKRADLAKAQTPFAIILGCSDSRVPAEIVFDQGLGDLFVIGRKVP